MLSEYEASVLTRQRAGGGSLRLAPTGPVRHRIGAMLAALSAVVAVGLLYSAWSEGRVSRATQVVPGSTIMNPSSIRRQPVIRRRLCSSDASDAIIPRNRH